MTQTSSTSESPVPEMLLSFEEELLIASDPGAVLQHYQSLYPELTATFHELAEAIEMLQVTPFRQAPETGAKQSEATTPTRLGPYRVVRSIGRGGMGEVYEAIEEPLGRRVAVKTIRPSEATSPSLLLRFNRERRILARLHHTNVVPIFATGCEVDLLYFAMPYLSGASLGQVIKTACSSESSGSGLSSSSFEDLLKEAHSRNQSASEAPIIAEPEELRAAGGISGPTALTSPQVVASSTLAQTTIHQPVSKAYIRTAVQVMASVAEGLHHAHEVGVVHRDLKPANIIVETNGHVWVLDFGLAGLKASENSAPQADAVPLAIMEVEADLTAGPVGTILYMAPEQHGDSKHTDVRCDVWSLGVTLYELLTLERPFSSKQSVLASNPLPPRRLTPVLDRDLEAVILKALHKDPTRRYPTAQALADDLNHWLRREPVSVWPTNRLARPAWRLWLWSKRNRGWAVALALAFLGCLSLGVYAEERRQHAEEREQAEARQVQILDIQRSHQGDHRQGWSSEVWSRIERMTPKPEEKWAIQAQAVAALSGLDTRTEHQLPIYAESLAYSPDGRLWLGHTGGGVQRWNPETDRLKTWPLDVEGPLAIRPDGSPWQLGPTYSERDRPDWNPHDLRPIPFFPLQLLDVERQVIVRSLPDPVEGGSRLLAWAIAPKGSHAAAAVLGPQAKQYLLVWDAESGKMLHRIATRNALKSPALPRPGLAFAPDASLLASWDGSGWVDLWSMTDGQTVASFRTQSPLHCVAFGLNHWYSESPRTSAERWMVAAGGADGLITLWNPATRGIWQLLRTPGAEILALAFSGDGTLLASAGRLHDGQLWDVATGRRLVEFITPDYTTALAFSPDGTHLASSYWYPFAKAPGTLQGTSIFALHTGRGIRQLHGIPGSVVKVVFSRDGKRVAALSRDWWAGVWDRDTGRLIRLCSVPRGQFADNADLAFSPDARSLAVSAGNTAILWNVESGETRRWVLPWGLVEAIAFADAGHLMLMHHEVRDGSRPPDSEAPSTTYPRVCLVRNLLGRQPAEPVETITDLNWSVQEIEASPDGTHFLVDGLAGVDRANLRRHVRAYRGDGTLVTELSSKILPSEESSRFIFDPTGQLLIQNSRPQKVLIELPSGRFLGSTPIISPDGVSQHAQLWAGRARDVPSVQVYDRSGKLLLDRFSEGSSCVGYRFSPDLDGRYLIWGNHSGAVTVADLVEIRRRLTGLGLGW